MWSNSNYTNPLRRRVLTSTMASTNVILILSGRKTKRPGSVISGEQRSPRDVSHQEEEATNTSEGMSIFVSINNSIVEMCIALNICT